MITKYKKKPQEMYYDEHIPCRASPPLFIYVTGDVPCISILFLILSIISLPLMPFLQASLKNNRIWRLYKPTLCSNTFLSSSLKKTTKEELPFLFLMLHISCIVQESHKFHMGINLIVLISQESNTTPTNTPQLDMIDFQFDYLPLSTLHTQICFSLLLTIYFDDC